MHRRFSGTILQWDHPTVRESVGSFFGDYGIEDCAAVPGHPGTFKAANYIRALLGLISEGRFALAQGMQNDFLCNDDLDQEVFSKVFELCRTEGWLTVNRFMGREYGMR